MMGTQSIDSSTIFQPLMMSFTVALVASSVVAVVLSIYRIWHLHALSRNICDLGQKVCNIHKQKLRRDSHFNLTTNIWDPPLNYSIANEGFIYKHLLVQPQHYNAKILHCYKPQIDDELHLHKLGDIITEVVPLENGWCKGNLGGKKGFFPASYVEIQMM